MARVEGASDVAASREYVESFIPEDEVLQAARAKGHELACTPIDPAGGSALRFLASAVQARAVVEVGTGTGVSGLWLLRGMREDGVLTTVDIDPEHLGVARHMFSQAGVPTSRTRLINGDGLSVLPRLTDNAYDLVFIDPSVKDEYPKYLDGAIRLLRPGGIVTFGGILNQGRVADPTVYDPAIVSIRELTRTIRESDDLVPVLLANGDGLLAAIKTP